MRRRKPKASWLSRYMQHFWRNGRLTWRGWLLIFFVAMFGGMFAFGPRWWPPSARAYCDALVQRGLARDCVKDTDPPPGATSSVQFTVARSGKVGRISRFSDKADYWREFHRWEKLEETADVDLLGYGRALVLGVVPGPFDVVDTEDFGHFHNEDMEAVTVGRELNWLGTREHPVHSEACAKLPACAAEGLCAIRPSVPDQCIAGFDKDCMASEGCRTKKLCHAVDGPPYTCGF